MLALNKGVPELLSLKRSIQLFIDFRKEVIFKRTKFHLRKTREKSSYPSWFISCIRKYR